jgi:hypothetical protein
MWSDPKIDSIVRVVPCRTLDGTRLVVEITVGLKRAHNAAVAQTIGDEVAAVLEEVVGEQIVQGQFPLTPAELETLVVRRANAANNRIASAKIVLQRKTAPVAAPRRSPSPPGFAAADPSAYTPPPDRPPRQGSAPSTMRLSMNPRPPAAASAISGTKPRVSAQPPALEDLARRSITPLGIPAAPRVPTEEIPLAAPVSTERRSVSPAPSSVREPPPVSTRRESTRPPSSIQPEALDASGEAIARLLRRLTAETLLSVFAFVASDSIDKLSLLAGKEPTPAIIGEISSCFAATVYQAATAAGAPHRRAIAVVESACRKASIEGAFATDIGRYIGSHSQIHDLAARVAEALSLPTQEVSLRGAIAPHHAALIAQLSSTALNPA